MSEPANGRLAGGQGVSAFDSAWIGRFARSGYAVFLAQLGSIVVFLLLWEAVALWWINPKFASPPIRVIANVPALVSNPEVAIALVTTFLELGAAFLLSVIIGSIIGFLIGLNRFTFRSTFPIILLIYATPQVTVLPLFILYFGLGPESKIAFGVSHGMFPVIVNVVAAIKNVRPAYVRSAHSMGASTLQVLRRVILPHAAPGLFASMRLSMAANLLGVLLAELYVSTTGIGYFTRLYSVTFDPTNLFSLILVLTLMAVFFNECVRRLERRFGRWR